MLEWFEGKDVALVGGAGAIFEQEYGDQIDKHEVVVRMNRGVIIKNAKSQGSKTDYWAIGKPTTVSDIIGKYKFKGNFHLSEAQRDPKHPNIDYYMPMEILNKLKSPSEYNYKKPSSGLVCLYYLYFHCKPKSLSLYGFDWNKSGTWYYIPWAFGRGHDWGLEERYIKRKILSQTNVTYYKPKETNKIIKFKDAMIEDEYWLPPKLKNLSKINRIKYLKDNSKNITYGD